MSWEIKRHLWSTLRAQGSAERVPAALQQLECAETPDAALAAYWKIDNVVVVQGAVYQAALSTVSYLMCSLNRCTKVARPHILELLVQIGSGEPAEIEIEAGAPNIVKLCLKELIYGLSSFLNILEQTDDLDEIYSCIDLLGLCCQTDFTLRDRVLWYYEMVKSRNLPETIRQLLSSWSDEVASRAPD